MSTLGPPLEKSVGLPALSTAPTQISSGHLAGKSTSVLLPSFPAAPKAKCSGWRTNDWNLARVLLLIIGPPKDRLIMSAPLDMAHDTPAAILCSEPEPSSPSTLPISSLQSGATPHTPTPLARAPIMPAHQVPCPTRSSMSGNPDGANR